MTQGTVQASNTESARFSPIEFLVYFARAIQAMRVYQEDHRLAEEALDRLHHHLQAILKERPAFVFGLIGDELIFGEGPLPPSEKRFKGLISLLKAFDLQRIQFKRGLTRDELRRFIQLLAKSPQAIKQGKGFQTLFAELRLSSVTVGGLGVPSRMDRTPVTESLKHEFQEGMNFLTQAFKDLKTSPTMNVQSARQIVEGLLNNIVKNKNLLPMLMSMRTYDEEVFEHGVHVSVFTLLQAEILGIEEKYLVDVGIAALLHDIGRVSESDADTVIPFGPDITFEEAKRQRDQDVRGAKILLETEGIPTLAAIAAFEKNIRYDFKGLPRKLYGKELNLVSMMIAIADYYDRIRRRPEFYEEGGPEKAYEEMMALSGTYFHPDLLANFFSVVGVYPPGTLVELDTGEIGLVIQENLLDIRRPQVEILYDISGKKHPTPQIVNLTERDHRGQYKRSIVKSILMADHIRENGSSWRR